MDSTDPEIQPPPPEALFAETAADTALMPPIAVSVPEPWETRIMSRIFLGSQGLRAGWSVLLFVLLFILLGALVGFVFLKLHLVDFGKKMDFTPSEAFFGELVNFLPLVGAAALLALIERRRSLLAYNLEGPRRTRNLFSGLAAGYLSLSALVGALTWGGWLHFGPVALSGAQIFRMGAFWGVVFLMVGCVEEGIFRCYLQFTLTRGINFWWALGIIGLVCVRLFWRLALDWEKLHGSWVLLHDLALVEREAGLLLKGNDNSFVGVFAAALLGFVPCLLLHLKKAPGAGFWQATWVTSTIFGFIHVSNNGENWIGIFAAAFVGFVFCVSVRLTGSAWWAIGCHACWDWAQTYFYGTADSGMVASGHYMTTTPAGNVLWSGGADGPEGSLLVLGILLLMLLALIAIYGRASATQSALERAIG
jgi:membrane protease YdiL (CAAX protease family)